MTLSIRGLKPTQLKELDRKARSHGKTTTQYVRALIERELESPPSVDEILKPIRDDFRQSGVTEAELDRIVERARNHNHRKSPRQGKRR
jgi:hypothetical protein